MSIAPFLRNVLNADALISGAAGILMMLGAPLLSPLLELPAELLFWAGLALVPFVAMLVVIARRPTVSKLVLIDIVAINALCGRQLRSARVGCCPAEPARHCLRRSPGADSCGVRRVAVRRYPPRSLCGVSSLSGLTTA
jgi:hypothetical protein